MYNRLRELREAKGLTSKEISQLLNMSQTGYAQYEIGINNISTDVLKSLSLFYNTSIDYLLAVTDERKPYPRRGG